MSSLMPMLGGAGEVGGADTPAYSSRSTNLSALAAVLRTKLTARLGTDSARLDELLKRLVEVDLTINEQRVRFQDAIRAIKLVSPLPVT
ncbi:MAG TPA: hypothetical protein VFH73_22475 [Polyangia bacterium]|nr:hypothetical protein [Polyangia bacterium]